MGPQQLRPTRVSLHDGRYGAERTLNQACAARRTSYSNTALPLCRAL
jgi:hypothetical protein